MLLYLIISKGRMFSFNSNQIKEYTDSFDKIQYYTIGSVNRKFRVTKARDIILNIKLKDTEVVMMELS